MRGQYFDDFEVGETYETNSRTITEADQLNYAGLSGNYDPIHLDKEYMAESEFGGRLVYGQLVHVVMEGLKIQTGIIEDSVIASYGMDSVRFVKPVMIGDTIHNEMEVIDLQRRDENSGILVLKEEGINQKAETVCVSQTKTLIESRN